MGLECLRLVGGRVLASDVGRRGFYGFSVVAGSFAAIDFLFVFLPKLAPLAILSDISEIILEHILPGLKGVTGGTWLAHAVTAVVLLWASAYAALEAFTRKVDDVSLWRHIAMNNCARLDARSWRAFGCTLKGWLATVAVGPILIVWALVKRIFTHTKFVSVGYVSLEPSTLVHFIKHLVLAIVLVIAFLGAIGYKFGH